MKNSASSLTHRVSWAMALTVALSVGLMAALAYSVMYEQEDELADQLLAFEMQRLVERLDSGELVMTVGMIELGQRMRAWVGDDGRASQPELVRGLPVGGPYEVETGTLELHVLSADSEHGRITLVFDATANEQRVSQFGVILFLLWATCAAAGLWVARLVGRKVVEPIRNVTERIANWDPESGTGAGAIQPGTDEPGRLLEAFNRMQDRVDQSMARQREFASNLSHEVRTPLAALRSDVEMLALDADAQALPRQRHDRILSAIDDISATIGATRALSQSPAAAKRQQLALAELLDHVIDGLKLRAEAAGLTMVNRVAASQHVLVDRYALLIVLRNLLGNAIDHAAPATLTLAFADGGLTISDDGPGIDAQSLPFVFDRYHRGRYSDESPDRLDNESERGLGLAIARRICAQQGWLIDVASDVSGPHRGTRFHLRFDENST